MISMEDIPNRLGHFAFPIEFVGLKFSFEDPAISEIVFSFSTELFILKLSFFVRPIKISYFTFNKIMIDKYSFKDAAISKILFPTAMESA